MNNIRLLQKKINKNDFLHLSLPHIIHNIINDLKKIYPNKTFKELYACIEFRSNTSLSFPKSEIENIEFKEKNGTIYVVVIVNFLSLTGTGTPLPIHYAEEVKDDLLYEDGVLLDFLSIFNHRLQKLVYSIWRKNRYYVDYDDNLKDTFSKYLLSIIGLYPQTKQDTDILNFHKLLPFLGILSMRQKSSGTLTSIIKHYMMHEHVTIDECVLSRANIPQWQKKSMGDQGLILGESFIIGDFLTVKNLKFRINLYQVSWKLLYEYTVLKKKSKELKDLISFALQDPFDFDLALHIDSKEIKPIALEKNSDTMLGMNTWLGIPQEIERIVITP